MFKPKERTIEQRIMDLEDSIKWDEMDIKHHKEALNRILLRVEEKHNKIKDLKNNA